MTQNPDEPDVEVEEEYTSVDQLNQRLPEGVRFEPDSQRLLVHGEKYDVNNVVSKIKKSAKERGPATYALTVGGVTLGLPFAGPIGGAAGSTILSIIGALYDNGYIEFTQDGLRVNIGEGSEYIATEEEAELNEPLEIHQDKRYEPDSDIYVIAIELPGGDRRYFKTEQGAANRLIHEHGS